MSPVTSEEVQAFLGMTGLSGAYKVVPIEQASAGTSAGPTGASGASAGPTGASGSAHNPIYATGATGSFLPSRIRTEEKQQENKMMDIDPPSQNRFEEAKQQEHKEVDPVELLMSAFSMAEISEMVRKKKMVEMAEEDRKKKHMADKLHELLNNMRRSRSPSHTKKNDDPFTRDYRPASASASESSVSSIRTSDSPRTQEYKLKKMKKKYETEKARADRNEEKMKAIKKCACSSVGACGGRLCGCKNERGVGCGPKCGCQDTDGGCFNPHTKTEMLKKYKPHSIPRGGILFSELEEDGEVLSESDDEEYDDDGHPFSGRR